MWKNISSNHIIMKYGYFFGRYGSAKKNFPSNRIIMQIDNFFQFEIRKISRQINHIIMQFDRILDNLIRNKVPLHMYTLG